MVNSFPPTRYIDWSERFEPWATVYALGRQAVCNLCIDDCFRTRVEDMTTHLKNKHVVKFYTKVQLRVVFFENIVEEQVVRLAFEELIPRNTDFRIMLITQFYNWKKAALAVNGSVLTTMIQKYSTFVLPRGITRRKQNLAPWLVVRPLAKAYSCISCPSLSWESSKYRYAAKHVKSVHFRKLYDDLNSGALRIMFQVGEYYLIKETIERLFAKAERFSEISLKDIYEWKSHLTEQETDLLTKHFLTDLHPGGQELVKELFPGLDYQSSSLLADALK